MRSTDPKTRFQTPLENGVPTSNRSRSCGGSLERSDRSGALAAVIACALLCFVGDRARAQVDFEAPRLFAASKGIVSAAQGDFDEDGFLDVAVGTRSLSGDRSVDVYLNDGLDGFVLVETLATVNSSVAVADWNLDGHLDIVTGEVAVFRGDGTGRFTKIREAPSAFASDVTSVVVEDLDRDGRPDIILASRYGDRLSTMPGRIGGEIGAESVVIVPAPASVTVADLDEDGHDDLVVPQFESSRLFVMQGDGTGNWSFGLDTLARSIDLRIADFDGDSALDIVFLHRWTSDEDEGTFVAFGDGNGNFDPPVRVAVQGRDLSDTMLVADFDEDGLPDVANGGVNAVEARLNDGNRGLGPTIRLDTEHRVTSIIAADVDGDGHQDIVAYGQHVEVFFGDGTGGFETSPVVTLTERGGNGDRPRTIVAADFDQDGRLDVAIGTSDGRVRLLIGSGERGAFSQTFTRSVGINVSSLTAGDLNSDGRTDLVATDADRLSVLLGNRFGGIDLQPPIELPGASLSTVVADFDQDGRPDVMATSGPVTALLAGDGSGGLVLAATYLSGSTGKALDTGDLNADGTLDLVVGDLWSGVAVLPGLPGGGFVAPRDIDPGIPVFDAAIADFDGDGHLDAAVSHADAGEVAVLHGDGSGDLVPAQTLSTGGSASRAIEALDLDGDGRSDLVVTDSRTRSAVVLPNTGGGDFGVGRVFQHASNSESILPGDFTSDGHVDFLLLPHFPPERHFFAVLASDGEGGFRSWRTFETGEYPEAVVAADFDQDGVTDVVASSRTGNSVSFLRGTGDGGLMARVDRSTALRPRGLATARLDGDRHPDLVVACETSDAVSVFLGDDEGLGTRADHLVGDGPVDVVTGDLDEDGHTDLVVANRTGRSLSFLFGDGSGGFSRTATDSELTVMPWSLALGDFDPLEDPDGHLDIAIGMDGLVMILQGAGDGTFEPRGAFPIDEQALAIVSLDVDLDGHLDLAVAQGGLGDLIVSFGNGRGQFPNPHEFPTRAISVAGIDVDGDGKEDLVARTVGSIEMFLAGGSRGLDARAAMPIDALAVTGADLDDDGQKDLVVTEFELDGGLVHVVRNRTIGPSRCRAGSVNDSAGRRAETLTVNGSIGAPRRELSAGADETLAVRLDHPPSRAAGSRYYVGVWEGAPTESTVARLPSRLGHGCFQPVVARRGYDPPLYVANVIRLQEPHPLFDPPRPGATGVPGRDLPADVLVIPPSFAPGTVLTVQGIIGDGASRARKPASITNAVVVHIE